MNADRAEPVIQATAAAITAAIVALALIAPVSPPAGPVPAPKLTQVTLSVVEAPPPPPPQPAPPPEPEPPPPPPQLAPSPLPPPPPPRPRHIVRPKTPPPPRPVAQPDEPPPIAQPQAAPSPRPAAQAPENHSAEAAYVGRLHAIVQRHTAPPDSAAYRLSHPSGEVLIGFTLSRGGEVSDVRVLRSSGSPVLDRQAVLIVSTQHYPFMPNDAFASAASHAFTVPVSFAPDTGAAEGL